MNTHDKKNDLDDSGLQTPPMIKNHGPLGHEPFSPVLYMNTQNVQNVNYYFNPEAY